MKASSVTHATGMGPLPDLLEERTGRKTVETVFSEVGLPLALIDERSHRLPMPLLARLFQRAAGRAGDPLFGLAVGSAMAPGDYGMWARYAMQARTLGEGIHRAIRTLHLHESGTAMRLVSRAGELAAWEYWHPRISGPLFCQHSDHLIPVMIRFVQGFLGVDWSPLRVELAYTSSQEFGDHEAESRCAWVCAQPNVAVVMRSSELRAKGPLLDGPPSALPLLGYRDVVADSTRPLVGGPLDHVAATMSLRLLDGSHDIDGAAHLLGTTSRTLQRRLEAHGLSYRVLLTRLRMQRAKSLIVETDAPLKKIGADLGYSDPAHFTRAFAKYFGYAPSHLRRISPEG